MIRLECLYSQLRQKSWICENDLGQKLGDPAIILYLARFPLLAIYIS